MKRPILSVIGAALALLFSATLSAQVEVEESIRPADVLTTTRPAATTQPAASSQGVTVYFSPNGNATAAIVDRIGKAKTSIAVQAYSFTSAPIAKALLDAQKRGAKVTVVLDASQRTAQYSAATFFSNQGVPCFIDSRHAIAHDKIILIDGKTVITGSFNFTKAAEQSNAENLLILDDNPDVFAAYEANFKAHLAHAVKYEGLPAQGSADPRGPPAADAAVAAARPAVAPPPPAPPQNPTVYVTKTGAKYHTAGCSYLAKSAIPMDLAAAKAKGYTPCSRCNPPL